MRRRRVYWIAFLLLLANTGRAQQIVDTVCASAAGEVYRVKYNPGSTYWWTVDCGIILTPPGADSIAVQWCSNPGLYTIRVVEFNRNGCPGDTISARVFVRNGLDVFITGPPEICRGEMLVLEAHGAENYLWDNGFIGPVLMLPADNKTDFTVTGLDGSCAPDSANFHVNIIEKPTADFTFNSGGITPGQNVNFTFTGNNARRLEWIFDNDPSSRIGGPNVTYRFTDSGKHEVKLIAINSQNCIDTIVYKVMVGGTSTVFMPNAFTPNGDGVNDVLKPVSHGIRSLEVIIYNRWGQVVKTISDPGETWDGMSNGKKVETGVYIYSMKAQGDDNQWHYLQGDITILY
jgi:gliding motility-associated-like protein